MSKKRVFSTKHRLLLATSYIFELNCEMCEKDLSYLSERAIRRYLHRKNNLKSPKAVLCHKCQRQVDIDEERRIAGIRKARYVSPEEKRRQAWDEQWKHRPSLRGEKGVRRRTLKDYE